MKLSAGSTLDQESRNEIEQELDEIEKFAPVVPDDINRAVEKRFKEYIFVNKAEDLRPEQEDRGCRLGYRRNPNDTGKHTEENRA